MKTIQAYRFALDLTAGQERDVRAHAGAARVAHNWALAKVKAVMDQRAAERSYGIPAELLTPSLSWSLAGLRKQWNAAKSVAAPWWAEISKEAFNTGAIRIEPDRMHVVLPRLGRLKLHESARKLARRLDNGTARILSATVRRDGERWHVSFTVQVEHAERAPARPGAVVGVDVGITHLAVLSTGELVENPRHAVNAHQRMQRLGRALSRKTGPDRRTGRRPSGRWRQAASRLSRAHARVANLRRDGLHKLTTRLATTYGTVVVEDLNVAGMLRNRRLARHVADAGFAEIRRQLAYKTGWNGGRLVVADRWYPSSKTCSGCGTVRAKLALSERTFVCEACGLVINRDRNAALNLAALAAQFDTAGSGPVAARGADQKTRIRGQAAVKRESGIAPASQTGTVPPQGRTIEVRSLERTGG
jgi:IS605 OrfB family transposase